MKVATASAIQSMANVLLASDESATDHDRAAIARLLAGTAPRKELLTAKQAAAALGICVRSLQAWGRAGRLTPVKFGRRRIRWDKAEVEAVAAQGFAAGEGRENA